MTGISRFCIGAVGGLTPVLALLMIVDYQTHFVDSTTPQTVGFVVRAIILFLAGGFWAWLHKTEDVELKIFQIGMAAPAVIAGALTANSLAPKQAVQKASANPLEIIVAITHSNSYAQPIKSTPAQQQKVAPTSQDLNTADSRTNDFPIRKVELPPLSAYSEFFEGFVGVPFGKPKDVWFTIVASEPTKELAVAKAKELNARSAEFKVEVFEPYANNAYWAVVIGSNLDRSAAIKLRDSARASGLPKDTYVWTDPRYR